MATCSVGDLGRRELLLMSAVLAATGVVAQTTLPTEKRSRSEQANLTGSGSYGPARRPRHGSKRFSKGYRSADTPSARML